MRGYAWLWLWLELHGHQARRRRAAAGPVHVWKDRVGRPLHAAACPCWRAAA
jgi:hypothetical protein